MTLIKAHTSIIGDTGYNCHSRNFFKALNQLTPVSVRNWTIGDSWKGYNDDEPEVFHLTDIAGVTEWLTSRHWKLDAVLEAVQGRVRENA